MTYTADQLAGLLLQNKNQTWINRQPGVVGSDVGINSDDPNLPRVCIRVYMRSDKSVSETTRSAIRERLKGAPVTFGPVISEVAPLSVSKPSS